MSTMAAGQLTPAEASEYLRQIQFPGSVVLGTSNPAHVSTTFGAFRNALRLVANAQ
jgi:hypothetical protein